MVEEEEELVFGIWEQEEFMDKLLFSLFVGLAGAASAFLYSLVSSWLDKHKWFDEKEKGD